MVQQLSPQDQDQLYPSSDGKPMADNTRQYRWLVLIKENLEILWADVPDVFIAADLLWYPIQVQKLPAPSQAPDVMVVFGRPKGERRSYRQWEEEDIPPKWCLKFFLRVTRQPLGGGRWSESSPSTSSMEWKNTTSTTPSKFD